MKLDVIFREYYPSPLCSLCVLFSGPMQRRKSENCQERKLKKKSRVCLLWRGGLFFHEIHSEKYIGIFPSLTLVWQTEKKEKREKNRRRSSAFVTALTPIQKMKRYKIGERENLDFLYFFFHRLAQIR